MSDTQDIELRDRVLLGDREAATVLFERFVDALYEFVFYRVGQDRAVCESIVEDTLLTAFENLRTYAGHSSLHTWMCGIAKNKIRSHRRTRKLVPLDDLLDQVDAEIHTILLGIEAEPLPEAVLERKETRDLVGATMASLPPEYREVLLDKYVHELSVNEIARKVNRKTKATESLLHRARAAFVKVFELLARRRGDLA